MKSLRFDRKPTPLMVVAWTLDSLPRGILGDSRPYAELARSLPFAWRLARVLFPPLALMLHYPVDGTLPL